MSEFVSWMNRKYLDWQMASGMKQTWKEFAFYLGVKPTTLSSWLNSDNLPTGDKVHLLADKLGPEIYDILEIDPPERRSREVRGAYNALEDDRQRDELQRRISRVIEDFFEEYGFKRTK